MRSFVVLIICVTLATPGFAQSVGPQGTAAKAPATAAPPPPPASEPSAADRAKWPPAVSKAWDLDNPTIKNFILMQIKTNGKLDDADFQKSLKQIVDKDAKLKGELAKKTPASTASAPQGVSPKALAPPTADASVADDVSEPIQQPARRNRDRNPKYDNDTEADAPCLNGECNGTQPGGPLSPDQREVVEQFATPPPRPIAVQSAFDWRSGLLGGVIGFGAGILFTNWMNNRNNNNNRYCGFGPGGQGYPWWNYQNGRPNQLPAYYRAPGAPYGMGYGGGYPMMQNGGGYYGGAFGVGANGFPNGYMGGGAGGAGGAFGPPATLPFPGPTQTSYNMFQSNGANIYNGYNAYNGMNSLGVQPNLFNNPNMGNSGITFGR